MKGLLEWIILVFFMIQIAETKAQQEPTSLIIVTNVDCIIYFDGDSLGLVNQSKPLNHKAEIGEHYIRIVPLNGSNQMSEIVSITDNHQKVLRYEIEQDQKNSDPSSIKVADLSFTIPGQLSQTDENPIYPTFYYAFETEDIIQLNLEMHNKKGTNNIEVFTYPDYVSRYSNNSFQDLANATIVVPERSIYGFTFSTNHAFDREVQLSLARLPKSNEPIPFNFEVSWQEIYSVQNIQTEQEFFINSEVHSTLQGGKSRILVPINLPENTVKWYFKFTASREESEVTKTGGSLNLFSELSYAIDQTGIVSMGIDQLTQPPGSHICDIYLLDHENISPFLAKEPFSYFLEGSRENYKSGVVEISSWSPGLQYLGIKNPDDFYGILVTIDVAAITVMEELIMHAENK